VCSEENEKARSSENALLDKLRNVIHRAFEKLLENDSFLLENDLHERAISHWFAVYLNDEIQDSFPKEKYNVDCEYNRDITRDAGRVKKAFLLKEEINAEFQKTSECKALEYFGERSVYPDIIVHKRGSNADNLLVIEIKKSNSRFDNNFDTHKLEAYTRKEFEEDVLKYKYGAFLEIQVCRKSNFMFKAFWFSEGKKIDQNVF